jgi:hypothetical protein
MGAPARDTAKLLIVGTVRQILGVWFRPRCAAGAISILSFRSGPQVRHTKHCPELWHLNFRASRFPAKWRRGSNQVVEFKGSAAGKVELDAARHHTNRSAG